MHRFSGRPCLVTGEFVLKPIKRSFRPKFSLRTRDVWQSRGATTASMVLEFVPHGLIRLYLVDISDISNLLISYGKLGFCQIHQHQCNIRSCPKKLESFHGSSAGSLDPSTGGFRAEAHPNRPGMWGPGALFLSDFYRIPNTFSIRRNHGNHGYLKDFQGTAM